MICEVFPRKHPLPTIIWNTNTLWVAGRQPYVLINAKKHNKSLLQWEKQWTLKVNEITLSKKRKTQKDRFQPINNRNSAGQSRLALRKKK